MREKCNFCLKERNEDNWCDCEGKVALGKLGDLAAPGGGTPLKTTPLFCKEWGALWDKITEIYEDPQIRARKKAESKATVERIRQSALTAMATSKPST